MTPCRLNTPSHPSRLILAGALLVGLAACGQEAPPKFSKATPSAPPSALPAATPAPVAEAPKAAPDNGEKNKALAARVKQALVAKKVKNAHAIDVTVEDGMVTLFGAVDDKPSRDMAEKVASGVDGVSMVHNNLAVAAGS
jgi:hypothetical protein